MEQLSKLKTELSKLSGVDFHSPKYREVFKRYFETDKSTEDTEVDDAKDNTEEADNTAQEPDSQVQGAGADVEDATTTTTEDTATEQSEEANVETEQTPADATTNIATETEAENNQSASSVTDELLNTKLELELVRAGIREDRLDTAKRLFAPEFKASGGNVEQIRELIAKYPEWIGKQGGVQGFGMPLGDKADALTNEEKALKQLGIDPRN